MQNEKSEPMRPFPFSHVPFKILLYKIIYVIETQCLYPTLIFEGIVTWYGLYVATGICLHITIITRPFIPNGSS